MALKNSLKEGVQQEQAASSQPNDISYKAKKKKIVIIAFVVVFSFCLCTTLGVGGYLLFNNKEQKVEVENEEIKTTSTTTTTTTTSTTSATTTQSPKKVKYPTLDMTLQDIITQHCLKKNFPGGYSYYIDIDKLPLSIDQETIQIVPRQHGDGTCIGGEFSIGKSAADFDFKEKDNDLPNTLHIFDNKTEELGHGGAPFYAIVGDTIKSTKDYKITAYLVGLDVGTGSIYEYTAYVRATRILTYKVAGKTYKIYAGVDIQLFNKSNKRFIQFLRQYAPTKTPAGIPILEVEEAQDNFVSYFFSDLNNLAEPEKSVYEQALEFMDAIEYRE